MQCYNMFTMFNKFTKLTSCVCIGKTDLAFQEKVLQTNPDIVFATPGRLVDIMTNTRGVVLEDTDFLVFDEADKLLEMGFKPEIETVLENCGVMNPSRQVLLFSATLTKDTLKMGKLALKNPLYVESEVDKGIPKTLKQMIIKLKSIKSRDIRKAVLLHLIDLNKDKKTIVFFTTKKECHQISTLLDVSGIKVPSITQ